MTLSISLFVIDPERGPRDESDLAQVPDLAALLVPEREAGLEIGADGRQLIIRDALDDLVLGVCVAGADALARGEGLRNVSFAGFDAAEIASDGASARFAIGAQSVSAPRDEAVAALRAQAGRFGRLLRQAFPGDPARAQEFLDAAAG